MPRTKKQKLKSSGAQSLFESSFLVNLFSPETEFFLENSVSSLAKGSALILIVLLFKQTLKKLEEVSMA